MMTEYILALAPAVPTRQLTNIVLPFSHMQTTSM